MTTSVSVTSIGGAAILVANITYSSLDWSKDLDVPGTAQVVVNSQCIPPQLLGAHPWVHELRIEVDNLLAFVGPIRFVSLPLNNDASTDMLIEAYDLSYWLALRFARLNIDYTGTNTLVSEVVRQITQAALSLDDPNMIPFLDIGVCNVVHDRVVAANDNAWQDHLDDIVGSVMHMRSHGRTVSFWCYGECRGTLPRVRADEFEDFDNLVLDGDRFTTDAALFGREAIEEVAEVVADPAATPPIVGKPAEAAIPAVLGLALPGGSPRFPGVRVERTFRDETYLDPASATRYAENAVVARAPLSFAEQETLRAKTQCDSPWPIALVAPGMCATVASRYGEHSMQIESVSGSVGTDGQESFSIGFNELLDAV